MSTRGSPPIKYTTGRKRQREVSEQESGSVYLDQRSTGDELEPQTEAEDRKYRQLYKALAAQLASLETESEQLNQELAESRHTLRRLRTEQILLYSTFAAHHNGPSKIAQQQTLGLPSIPPPNPPSQPPPPSLPHPPASTAPLNGNSDNQGANNQRGKMQQTPAVNGNEANDTPRKTGGGGGGEERLPSSAYMLFCRFKRAEVCEQLNNTNNIGEVNRVLGEMWRALPNEERDHYKNIYKEKKAAQDTADVPLNSMIK